MYLQSIEDVKNRINLVACDYAKQNKWIFKIDGAKGEIRLRESICAALLDFKRIRTFRRIVNPEIAQKELGVEAFKLYERQKKELIKSGFFEESMMSWQTEGISLKELRDLIYFDFSCERSTVLQRLCEEVGDKQIFVELLDGLIPKEVFNLLDRDQNTSSLSRNNIIESKDLKATHIYNIKDKELKERSICKNLVSKIGGAREVPTLSGRIDILTRKKLIEVKCGNNWKCGIGQLIAYGTHKPDRQLVLYLFDYEDVDLDNVRLVCSRAGIEVELHS